MTDASKQKLYTLRYLCRNDWGKPDSQAEAIEILNGLLGDGARPQADASPQDPGQKLLWCPFAETAGLPRSPTRGHYKNGYPKGAIVHFTAGHRSGVKAGIEEQVRNGYTYFVIDRDGRIGQNFPLDSWGYHAGASSYKGLDGTVSDELVGIEIQAGGRLESNGKTWFGKVPDEIREIKTKTVNQQPGKYEAFTKAQEESLIRLLTWLRTNNPDVFSYDFVLGHDEVSPSRKDDPGGALSMTMPALREKLKA